jgi:hypothetical protein
MTYFVNSLEREKILPMIADLNQVRLTKMAGRRFQEGVLVFANPADQKSNVKAFTYKCSLQDCSERQRLLVEIGIIKRSETLSQVTHFKPAFFLRARG